MACGGTVDVQGTGGGNGGDGGSGGSGGATVITVTAAGGGGEGGGGGVPEGFCEEACAVTAEGGCLSPSACEEHCTIKKDDWPEGVAGAFAKCAAENPLCFESVEGCILSQLHPPGSDNTARVKGTGFQQYDGKVVRVWHDPGTGVMFGGEAVISGGAFQFEWTEPFQAWDGNGPLILYYIDMDASGTCDAAADLTGAQNLFWNGDYIDAVYEAVLTPPLSDPDFVCDFTP
jgi:hypothetical protein